MEGGFQPNRKGGVICYTDAFKTTTGIEVGVYGWDIKTKLGFSLGQSTTIFLVVVHAIKTCIFEEYKRKHNSRRTYILSNS
jgi:hypothetical protein